MIVSSHGWPDSFKVENIFGVKEQKLCKQTRIDFKSEKVLLQKYQSLLIKFALLYPVFVSFISVLHIILIHQFGGSNPLHTGNIKETITFHPYFKIKDMLGMILVCSCLSELICYTFHLGHSVNYILANPLITPEHIVPEWYFLALYGILRAIPNKLFGIISMFSLIIHFIQAFILHE